MPHLSRRLDRVGDGLFDLLTHGGAETLAQPVDRHGKRLGGHAGLCAGSGVAIAARLGGEEGFDRLEVLSPATSGVFGAEDFEGALHEDERPALVEQLGGTGGGRKLVLQPCLTAVRVEREHGRASPALLRPPLAPVIRKQVIERPQEKGTEPAPVAICRTEGLVPQQACKQRLREVLRIRRGMSAPPDFRIERRPVGTAQILQCRPRTGFIAITR